MMCFQCEQTKHGKACSPAEGSVQGVCGKTPETAALQDLLVHYSMGIAQYAHLARVHGGLSDVSVDRFLLDSLFSTLTNVNFDADRFVVFLAEAEEARDRAKSLYEKAVAGKQIESAHLSGPAEMDLSALQGQAGKLETIGHMVGVNHRKELAPNPDAWSLGELLLYGLKGTAAYADHARILGKESEAVYAFIHEAMAALANLPSQSTEGLLKLALRCGETNLEVMELLDAGSTGRYGHPRPTEVRTTPVKGKCIAVSGHDLRDLEEILKRTAGRGINVYTHGELLPAFGYPKIREAYPHLVGNYGGAWQAQKVEFARFPGPVVVTTNCLIEPQKAYKDRIYTRGVVGWRGVKHIKDWDSQFPAVIEQALAMPGFTEDKPKNVTTTGYGRDAVLSMAGDIVNAINTGDIKQLYLIGGCDGAEANRTYFRDIATGLPRDAVILTLGCGKYRMNKLPFEPTLGGIPRLLDMGQCNDAYSAIKVATALAEVYKCDVNDLPLQYAISWFEQKAVAVFLTMLFLGLKNIKLGPQLPAFLTPNVLQILADTYGVKQVNLADHDADLKEMIARTPR
ncbi:hypothetical protein NSK_004142 [Nannochloropsis salina CCMP1776]|uniref:Hydroxylamine reductase n=1 Tax=Nannochloropsis salina CCMP1776 TaxID=1027361 RepID=A0A4D9D7R2_9STRA|nr:hypothetical protein NSK_004142 [Nannochloropsis salina CCMP1776]|eukprot:TFJ84678.1 hypothetical protein NSK_004142 [Nannochloropsis salina CCMP1776]